MALIHVMDVVGRIRECAALVGIDLGVDPDEIRLQVALFNSHVERRAVYSTMATGLNAMMLDDAARAQYREIWGEDWTEIPPMAGQEFDGLPSPALLERDSPIGATIPSSPRARRSR